MQLNKAILTTVLIVFACTPKIDAQEPDPVFVEQYKAFREITDSLSSYALYLVPYGSTNKIRLSGAYQSRLTKVYHFLNRNKKINFTEPDFIIGILIDDEEIEPPRVNSITRVTYNDHYTVTVTYKYKVNLLIHTKNRKELRFNLGEKLTYEKVIEQGVAVSGIRDSLSRRIQGAMSVPPAPTIAELSSNYAYRELQMTVEDYKLLLSRLLEKFTNYYVDRVDN